MTGTGIRRAALFVDFDNIYLGLRRIDVDAAERFATDPAAWVDAITEGDGRARRFLVRNCYLNPTGFSRYRASWSRAGFGVIDCPSLTQQGKSSADINLVLDVVDVLQGSTHVDEFFIASADADFTSLVRRLRAADRWTSVVVAGPVASAYRAVADQVVQADDLLELIASRTAKSVMTSRPDSVVDSVGRRTVLEFLRTADGPVDLATLAHRARISDPTLTRDWGEYGSFRAWLAASDADIGIDSSAPGWAWDAARFSRADLGVVGTAATEPSTDVAVHSSATAAPDSPAPGSSELRAGGAPARLVAHVDSFTALQREVTQVTDVPRLTRSAYRRVLTTLHRDLAVHPLDINVTSKRVRDECGVAGEPVGRTAISFVIRGLQYSDLDLRSALSLSDVAAAWTRNVESLCGGARIEFDAAGLQELRSWVSGGLLDDESPTSE
ncbi:NYN domain-containing protein [Agromyces sp. SYSU T00266]|uniref:NYN domain-containing protein n=1 Tax=Agromyces zhanjiangensis TaxID=3158562 RepID=UPI00339256CE